MLKTMSKFQGVLKMFMLGMLKTMLKTMLKYIKKHHYTLQCVLKLSGRFHFSSSILHTFLGSCITKSRSSCVVKLIYHLLCLCCVRSMLWVDLIQVVRLTHVNVRATAWILRNTSALIFCGQVFFIHLSLRQLLSCLSSTMCPRYIQ